MAHILYLFLAASLRSRELRWVFSFTIERRSRVFQRPLRVTIGSPRSLYVGCQNFVLGKRSGVGGKYRASGASEREVIGHLLQRTEEPMSKYAELKGKKVVIKPSWYDRPTIGTIIAAEDEGLWLTMEAGVSPSEFSIELPKAVETRISALKNGVYFIPLSHIHYVLSERSVTQGKK